MFFAVSKIFWLFAQPVTLLLVGLLVSILAIALGYRRLALAFSGITAIFLLLAGFTTLGSIMLQPLEDRFPPRPALPERIDGVVVLGGYMEGEVNASRGGHEVNRAADRVIETMRLARLYPEARIVVSGGEGTFFDASVADAISTRALFSDFGLTGDRFFFEEQSRNTLENAVYSRDVVKPKPGETWLLVTSAFHMPRSVGCFRQAGFPVIAWPVDYSTRTDTRFTFDLQNPSRNLTRVAVAMREWLGLAAYWLSGKIGEVLPAPGGASVVG
ncbi:hypothetical protein GCM10011491_06920 [Brucella endophytica]|uniref:DUF218 domain-containing protein n=1 Tax=Brucella endophytica TaxID=1963359 RepID=A0A916S3D5_9HYPH|nr:YdcF family protein [Brucella endophytica]GGA82134.1 hypothetical protein GCM10011491_06920 [Brucella endophytica]